MADVTHDAEDGFHEIHLTGKQLAFLFMATTVVSVVIFLCGVLVGRGVRAGRTSEPASESIVATQPAPSDTAVTAATPPAEPPPPAAEEGELSYKKRLESEASPPERLKTSPAEPRDRDQPAKASSTTVPAQNRLPAASSGARPGTWVVQLVAIKDRAAASSIVERLKGKGYPAFLVNPAAGSPARVFKVQVGRYHERGEADRVADRLRKEERFQPWVQR